MLSELRQEIAQACRTLRRSPVVTVVVVTMLAVGLGLNAAVFRLVDAAILHPWPQVKSPEQIVQVAVERRGAPYADFIAWRAGVRSFRQMALLRGSFHTISDGGDPEARFTTEVSSNIHALLGVKPALGRDFLSSDERSGAPLVAILRYEVWATRFQAETGVIGRTVQVDGEPATIIGVTPKGFSFPGGWKSDLSLPLRPPPGAASREISWGGAFALARLAEGVTIRAASAEMTRTAGAAGPHPQVRSFEDWYTGAASRQMNQILWAAAGLVLLVVCANVGNLLGAQAAGRTRDIAIRRALGAGSWRILRRFLTESLLLALAGGMIGLALAQSLLRIYAWSQASDTPLELDLRMSLYLLALVAASGILGGATTSLYFGLKNATLHARTHTVPRRWALVFIGAQFALSVTLFAGATMLTRSLWRIGHSSIGIEADNVLTFNAYTDMKQFPDQAAQAVFYARLRERLESIPGVTAVAFGAVPTESRASWPFELLSTSPASPSNLPRVGQIAVTDGYFSTLGAHLLAGRDFTKDDRNPQSPVAIVNERFASSAWPGESPVGKRLRIYDGTSKDWLRVVGVASNIVQGDRTRRNLPPLVYVPAAQKLAWDFGFVRASISPEAVVPEIRRRAYELHPAMALHGLEPLSSRLSHQFRAESTLAGELGLFASIAAVLAVIGIWAAVTQFIRSRRQEMGVRVALGAGYQQIAGLLFRQTGWGAIAGAGCGVFLSLAIGRFGVWRFSGLVQTDPMALISSCLGLVVIAILACWLPARKAAQTSPAVSLRHD